MSECLKREVMLRDLMSQLSDELCNMHITRCHEVIQLELDIAELKANVRNRIGVLRSPCQVVKNNKLELVPQEEGVVVNIEEILCICNRAKPIKFQDVDIEGMILKLQEKAKKILYGNFSSFGDESVTHLRAKNYEIQFLKGW